jgi:hypothetical protein
MFGVLTAMVTFAGPANAEGTTNPPAYPPSNGTQVLGTGATAAAPGQAQAAGTGSLAFTGSNAIGAGAFGGLLLVGGGVLLAAGKRRKVNG